MTSKLLLLRNSDALDSFIPLKTVVNPLIISSFLVSPLKGETELRLISSEDRLQCLTPESLDSIRSNG